MEKKPRPRAQNMKRKRIILESECETMKMSGIDVKLPPKVKPYPSQKLMMFRILQSLKSCQNAMIESPTGSGKTLGLLSSTCAWLQDYQVQRQQAKTTCPKHGASKQDNHGPLDMEELESSAVVDSDMDFSFNATGMSRIAAEMDDDDDFVVPSPVLKRRSMDTSMISQANLKRAKVEEKEEQECTCLPRVRIYYGTRTHKQIGQVVKEFSRLPYAGVIKHTILASREQSCIHAEVKKSFDVTGTFLAPDGPGCAHKQNIRAAKLDKGPDMRRFIEKNGDSVWDLEDLVDTLSHSKPTICPYFASTRVLTSDADLIFCPFSYLLDPIIRDMSDVFMNKAIVILDEAHNVEDTCREAASFDFTEAEITSAMEELNLKRMILRKAQERVIAHPSSHNSPTKLPETVPEVLDEVERHLAVLTHFVKNLHDWFVSVTSDVVNAPVKFGGRQTKTMSFAALSNSLKDSRWHGLYFKKKENEDQASSDEDQTLHRLHQEISLTHFVKNLHDWFVSVTADVVNAPVKFGGRQTKTMSFAALSNSLKDSRWHGLYFKKKENEDQAGSDEDQTLHRLHQEISKSYNFMCTVDKPGPNGQPLDEIMEKVLSAYKLSGTTIVCMEKFIYFMTYYSRNADGINNMTTYKGFVCIEKEFQSSRTPMRSGGGGKYSATQSIGSQLPWNEFGGTFKEGEEDEGGWKSTRKHEAFKPVKPGHKVTLSLWCMVPALSFKDAFSSCRSVILASGTLTPVDTFESELGMTFKFKMEGNQVIPKEQIFASVVSRGPNGARLCATYKNINENDIFTQELSEIIKSVCETVPKGVLCFFPSYRLLDKVYQYMEQKFILKKMEKIKAILREPRRSSELQEVMDQYERAIENPKLVVGPQGNGALMFAVFRGKVSEGIDFTDDRARCVISVGIPYPNAVDEHVVEKKKYNDDSSKPNSVMPIRTLPGDVWYSTQAYRALNQALGRCLRHRNDWGALVLVDERFVTQSFQGPMVAPHAKISKWVKEQLVIYDEYSDFKMELGEFVERMQNRDRDNKKLEAENKLEDEDNTEWKSFSRKTIPSILIE
uniref:DNA helicase n=1 Tax=Steinernema glaseri TaxID=37863 RepID=A0A1I8AKG0_9BILA